MKKWPYFRKIIQLVAIALLFLPLFMKKSIWQGTYIASDIFAISMTDPLSALEVSLAGKMLYWPLISSTLLLILAALIGGRIFCSWICPVNTVMEVLAWIKSPRCQEKGNNYSPYWVLVIVLITSTLISLPVFTIISPIGALSRAVTFGIGIEALLLVAIIAGEWIWERKAWCRKLCPAGAFYGILGRWRFLRIRRDADTCNNCGKCLETCSMQVEPGLSNPLHLMNCTNCADCISSCNQEALRFGFVFNQKGGNVKHESIKSHAR